MKNSDLKRFFENDASNNDDGFARLNGNGAVNAPVASNKIDTGNTADGKLMAANGQGGVKFVDDNSGTTVVANPTLAGTEAGLTGLQVGETKYKVDAGTTVVANPVLAGTEADLTGLQVGETKYKIPSGGSGAATHITLMDLVDIDDVIATMPSCIIGFNTSDDTFISWCETFAQEHGYDTTSEDKYFEIAFYPTCTNYLSDSNDNHFGGALLDVKFDTTGNMYFSNTIGFLLHEFPSGGDSPIAYPGPFYNCILYRCTDGSEAETGYIKVTENIPELPFTFSEYA